MKNKGFTLVELIAVIVILSLLMILLVPNVTDVSKNSKTSLRESKIKTIVSAAEKFTNEYIDEFQNCNTDDGCKLDIKTLIKNGYLESENDSGEVIDPTTNEAFFGSIRICYDISKNTIKSIYTENLEENKCNVEIVDDSGEEGIENEEYFLSAGDYSDSSILTYAGLEWYVVKDNGNTVTLVLKDNYNNGSFGNSTTYEGSIIYNNLNGEFVNTYLKNQINDGALVRQGKYINNSYYVRLLEESELSVNRPLPNDAEESLFWTMSANGEELSVGSKDGKNAISYFDNIGESDLYLTTNNAGMWYGYQYESGYDGFDPGNNTTLVAGANKWYKSYGESKLTAIPQTLNITFYSKNSYESKKGCILEELTSISIYSCGIHTTSSIYGNWYYYNTGVSFFNGWNNGYNYYANYATIYTVDNPEGITVYYVTGTKGCMYCNFICDTKSKAATLTLCTNPIEYYVPTEDNTEITSSIGYRPVIEVQEK